MLKFFKTIHKKPNKIHKNKKVKKKLSTSHPLTLKTTKKMSYRQRAAQRLKRREEYKRKREEARKKEVEKASHQVIEKSKKLADVGVDIGGVFTEHDKDKSSQLNFTEFSKVLGKLDVKIDFFD